MNISFMKQRAKLAVLSGLMSTMLDLSAHASLYAYNYTPASPLPIPQGGSVLTPAPEIIVSGISASITSVQIILTFNDGSSLGATPTIQGLLDLGTSGSSPYISLSSINGTPVSGSQEQTYTATFSSLNGYNPNNNWDLVLWDTSHSGLENGLVSWTLDITAVPEPISFALAVFGLVFVGVGAVRFFLARRRVKRAD
jgi:hypothetical protein